MQKDVAVFTQRLEASRPVGGGRDELADRLVVAGMSSPRDGHNKELQSLMRSPGSGGRSRRAGAGGRGSAARAADVDSVQRAAATTPAHGTSTRANGPDSVQAALAALNLPGSQWLAGGQDDRPRVREKISHLLENDMTAGSRVIKLENLTDFIKHDLVHRVCANTTSTAIVAEFIEHCADGADPRRAAWLKSKQASWTTSQNMRALVPAPPPWLTAAIPPFPPNRSAPKHACAPPPSPPGPRASASHAKTASPHIPPCVARCLLCRCSGLRNLTFRFRSPLLQPVDYPHVALLQPYKWARLSGPVSLTSPHICRSTTQSPLILMHNTAHQVQQARMTGSHLQSPEC